MGGRCFSIAKHEGTMTTKTITICGRDTTLAYCNATEIAFKMLSDENIGEFFTNEVFPAINAKPARLPDMRKTIFLVVSAINSYYDYAGKQSPVSDRELMYEAKAGDIPKALAAVIELYGTFYATPGDEKDEDRKEEPQKNA